MTNWTWLYRLHQSEVEQAEARSIVAMLQASIDTGQAHVVEPECLGDPYSVAAGGTDLSAARRKVTQAYERQAGQAFHAYKRQLAHERVYK